MTCLADVRAVALLLAIPLTACAGSPTLASDAGGDAGSSRDAPVTEDASSPDVVSSPADADSGNNPSGRRFEIPGCPTDQAPLPPGNQTHDPDCIIVGATLAASSDPWPSIVGARAPLVYVDNMAAAGGIGTDTQPFRFISEAVTALMTAGNGTIVLHAGDHPMSATLTIAQTISVLGVAGPTGSVIDPPAGMPAFQIDSPVSFTLTGVQLNKATPHTGAVLEASAGATLSLREVDIEMSEDGVSANGAHVDAQNLTIGTTTGIGLDLGASGDANLRSLLIAGGNVGIRSTGASLVVSQALVRDTLDAGVRVEAGTLAAHVTLDRVATVRGGRYGMYFNGAALSVDGSQLMLTGARFGLWAGGSATVSLDSAVNSDALRGRGSQIRANTSAGIVLDTSAHASIRGAFVASNGESGMIVQNGASASEIGYGWFTDNRGGALIVSTGGSIAGLLCDGFVDNLAGTVNFATGPVEMQDAVTINPGASHPFSLEIAGNIFQNLMRFNLLCVDVTPNMGTNMFMNSEYDWGVYGATATGTVSMNHTMPAQPTEVPGAI